MHRNVTQMKLFGCLNGHNSHKGSSDLLDEAIARLILRLDSFILIPEYQKRCKVNGGASLFPLFISLLMAAHRKLNINIF